MYNTSSYLKYLIVPCYPTVERACSLLHNADHLLQSELLHFVFSPFTSFFFFLTFLAGCIDCCLSVSARGLNVSKGCSSFPLTLGAAHRGLHSVMCFEATVVTLKVTNWNIQDLNVVIKPDIMYKLCFFFFFHRWVGWKWNDNKGNK